MCVICAERIGTHITLSLTLVCDECMRDLRRHERKGTLPPRMEPQPC